MGKKSQTTTNSYTQIAPNDTADTIAYRKALENIDLSSPVINQFARQERDVKDNAFYDNSMPEWAKRKAKFGNLFELNTNKGAALGQAKGQEQQIRTAGLANLAGMTQNRILQDGQTTVTRDPWGTALGALGAGAGIASMIGTGGASGALGAATASAGPATGVQGGLS